MTLIRSRIRSPQLLPLLAAALLINGGCRKPTDLASLAEGQEINGFALLNLYDDAAGNMTLSSSQMRTNQLNTVYHFHTLAGEDAFYQTLEARLNALLNPDFTDEEIRREVAHVSVAEDPATGELVLE